MRETIKAKPGSFVRDCISQQTAKVGRVEKVFGDREFYVYHLCGVPQDANYPHGARLNSEIAPLKFIGPLLVS